jgi:hypothetical protein
MADFLLSCEFKAASSSDFTRSGFFVQQIIYSKVEKPLSSTDFPHGRTPGGYPIFDRSGCPPVDPTQLDWCGHLSTICKTIDVASGTVK